MASDPKRWELRGAVRHKTTDRGPRLADTSHAICGITPTGNFGGECDRMGGRPHSRLGSALGATNEHGDGIGWSRFSIRIIRIGFFKKSTVWVDQCGNSGIHGPDQRDPQLDGREYG